MSATPRHGALRRAAGCVFRHTSVPGSEKAERKNPPLRSLKHEERNFFIIRGVIIVLKSPVREGRR